MATNAQDSGPLPGQKFTLGRWRQIFGAQAAIVGDTDGSAFALTLPPSGNDAVLGSPTIESIVLVGGHPLIIAAGDTQEITIPASTNPTIGRTDIIAARRDAATFTTPPGPVRLVRIAGTEGSAALPSYSAPLTEALWAVTRKQGQALNQATPRDLRNRSAKSFLVPAGSPLPQDAPLGARATRDGSIWRRDLDGSSVQWVLEYEPPVFITNPTLATMAVADGWARMGTTSLERDGRWRIGTFTVRRSGSAIESNSRGGMNDITIVQLHPTDRPTPGTPLKAYATDTSNGTCQAGVHVSGQWITLDSLPPNTEISNPGVGNHSLIISDVWKVD